MVEYGEGSLRKWRGKWQGVLPYRDESGKRKKKYKTFDDIPCDESSNRGKPAALKAMAEWKAELVKADEDAAQRLSWSDMPTGEYCRRYIEVKVKTGQIDLSTSDDYYWSAKTTYHTDYPIGNIPIIDLTRHDVEQWEISMLDSGLSPVTVAKRHRLLNQCLKHASIQRDIPRNPMEGMKQPKQPKKPKNALDSYQRSRLMAILDQMEPTGLKAAIALALYGGLREAEACSLRWKNADLRTGQLTVCEAIGRTHGGTYEKDPKNSYSSRSFQMPDLLIDVLKERRAAMMEECMNAGVIFSGDLRVCGTIDGRYANPTVIGKQWGVLARAHGLKGVTGEYATFIDLRHTCATVAVASHVDVRTVADILGHKDPSMTLRVYAVPDPDAKRGAAERINAAYENPSEVIGFRKEA